MKTVLIYATRLTLDGKVFEETIRVPGSALLPICFDWFTAVVPAVDIVPGMKIESNSDDVLMVDRVTIFETSDIS